MKRECIDGEEEGVEGEREKRGGKEEMAVQNGEEQNGKR